MLAKFAMKMLSPVAHLALDFDMCAIAQAQDVSSPPWRNEGKLSCRKNGSMIGIWSDVFLCMRLQNSKLKTALWP